MEDYGLHLKVGTIFKEEGNYCEVESSQHIENVIEQSCFRIGLNFEIGWTKPYFWVFRIKGAVFLPQKDPNKEWKDEDYSKQCNWEDRWKVFSRCAKVNLKEN